MTPIEQAIEALARCTPYMYKYSPVEAYVAHCTLVDALRAQPNIKNYPEKDICTAFTDWWNWSDGSPSYQDAFKAGYESALRAQPDHSGLAKDAARYRWLRTWEIDSYFATGKLELDAEIDRAMAADALEGKV